jgi:hypothetical protein
MQDAQRKNYWKNVSAERLHAIKLVLRKVETFFHHR